MEQVVALVAADKDPAMASSPTVNLLELCKKALTKWKEQKARCPERSHPGVSRARKAAARNVPAHHNDHRDADTFSVLPESAPTPEELALLAALIAEEEDGPRLDLPTLRRTLLWSGRTSRQQVLSSSQCHRRRSCKPACI